MVRVSVFGIRKVACFQTEEKNGILTEKDMHSSITGEIEKGGQYETTRKTIDRKCDSRGTYPLDTVETRPDGGRIWRVY